MELEYIENTNIVAKAIQVAIATCIAGKHRDLGSIFSHETRIARLLTTLQLYLQYF